MTTPVEHTTLAIGTLTITPSDASFQTGYDIGYREYIDLHQGQTMSDHDLLSILLDHLAGIAHTSTYKIGLITGWYAALFEKRGTS